MSRRGEKFERSVFEFYKGLDPAAQVLFDHKVRDRDTGTYRQVDVWVVSRLLGQIPVNTLISCKDHARPLDIHEVESFAAEMRSTGAQIGVLYASNGFTGNALEKSRSLGIACCRLFEDQVPDHPSELLVTAFVAHPHYRLQVEAMSDDTPSDVLWRDVLLTRDAADHPTATLCENIFAACLQLLAECTRERVGPDASAGPVDLIAQLSIAGRPECPPFKLHVAVVWQWHRGTLNAFRLSGSLNASAKEFNGATEVGPFSMSSAPHATIWEPCPPPSVEVDAIRITVTMLAGPTPEIIYRAMGPHKVFGGPLPAFSAPLAEELEMLAASKFGQAPAQDLGMTITVGSVHRRYVSGQ